MLSTEDASATALEFDTSNMILPLHDALNKLALDCDDSQCTAEESDESSQAGVSFAHLKRVDTPIKKSILKNSESECFVCPKLRSWKSLPAPDLSKDRQVSDLTVLLEEENRLKRSRSCVSFHEVSLRFYDQCLGDHPSTSYGPPISLDWNFEEAEPISIDEYEEKRGQRRTLRQLMVNYYQRRNILMWTYGVTEEELKKATKASGRVAFQRAVTKYFLPVSKVEECIGSAARKTKRIISRKPKSPVKIDDN